MPKIGEIKQRTGIMGKDTEKFPLITVRSHQVWNGVEWRPVPMGCTPERFSEDVIAWSSSS